MSELNKNNETGSGGWLLTCGVIVLCALTFMSISVLRPRMTKAYAQFREDRLHVTERCLSRAADLVEAGCHDDAFRYFQLAVANAVTPEERIVAGLSMGEFLARRARTDPSRYAVMAEQYLGAVLATAGADKEACLSAHRGIMRCAILLSEFEKATYHASEAVKLVDDNDARADLLLSAVDASIELGTWGVSSPLLEAASEYSSDPKWQHQFAMREAIACEQILLRPNWFEQWSLRNAGEVVLDADRASSEASINESVRRDLLMDTVSRFQILVDSGVEKLVRESLFRIARLYFHEGQYTEARKGFYAFFEHEPEEHQAEALLMMTKIARHENRSGEAEKMISTFLKRFSWNATAADEFFAIMDNMERMGRAKEALVLVESYKHLPGARERLPELLSRAGTLAKGLGLYPRSEDHFRALLDVAPRDDLGAFAMLQLASIRLKLNDSEGAQQWLVKYLNRFPYDKRHGDAFFMLLDVLRSGKAGSAEVIAVAVAAANRNPEDERAAAALMDVARTLEYIGLPSLAGRQYSKLALLQCVSPADIGANSETNGTMQQAGTAQAVLGNARCLLKDGQTTEADHLLRELCNNLSVSPERSEAAYYWSTIASQRNQLVESARRLHMVDSGNAPADIAARAALEGMLLDITAGKRSAKTVGAVLDLVKDVPAREHTVFVRKAYVTCFNALRDEGDTSGMRSVLKSAIAGPHRDQLPISVLSLSLAKATLQNDGIMAFGEELQAMSDDEGSGTDAELQEWGGIAVALKRSQSKLDGWLGLKMEK